MRRAPSPRSGAKAPGSPAHVHATAVVVGESGVLIRGASGAGKTSLGLALVEDAARHGLFARLVGDDRVALRACGARLVARPHPTLAGLVERRGWGLQAICFEPACLIRLVVDLVSEPGRLHARLPDEKPTIDIEGTTQPWLVLPAQDGIRTGSGRIITLLCALR